MTSTTAIADISPIQDKRLTVASNNWVHGKFLPMQSGLASLFIDELPITRVPIVTQSKKYGKFVFRPASTLINALPEQYTLSVELPNGERLHILDNAPIGSGDGSFREKLDDGFAVSAKAGYLYRPLSSIENFNEQIFGVYDEAREIFSQIEGTSELFVAYGSLLGLVRDNALIANDDDFDAGFIVTADNPNEAAKVMYRVMDDIRAMGYQVANGSHLGNFYLQIPNRPMLDIFIMYYREKQGELCSYNLTMNCIIDDVLPVKSGVFAGHEILTPNNPEMILEATYGEMWRIPDPYFQWNITRRQQYMIFSFKAASKAIEAGKPIPDFIEPSRMRLFLIRLKLKCMELFGLR